MYGISTFLTTLKYILTIFHNNNNNNNKSINLKRRYKMVIKCKKCGYEWTPRIKNPKACPMCKQYNHQKNQGVKNNDNLKK